MVRLRNQQRSERAQAGTVMAGLLAGGAAEASSTKSEGQGQRRAMMRARQEQGRRRHVAISTASRHGTRCRGAGHTPRDEMKQAKQADDRFVISTLPGVERRRLFAIAWRAAGTLQHACMQLEELPAPRPSVGQHTRDPLTGDYSSNTSLFAVFRVYILTHFDSPPLTSSACRVLPV